ncbi:MAG: transcription-repair coupling factor, partial [Burkholderiales bacterium]|nr:transcription-repair coupling factor [Burkholderiales bacterium]
MTNKAFEELPILGEPITELDESQKRRQTRPAGSAISLEIAQNASLLKEKKELLTVICSDPSDVIRFKEEVKYFDPSLNIVSFPDWETLPYDVLSPHADLIGERLETLYLLLKRENAASPIDVLVVSSITAAQRLAPKNFFNSTTFFFKKGQKTDPIKFRSELVNSGYEHVSQVIAPGEFATRGGIVDLYPMGATAPYRIDFFDDEVDEIRIFDPDTQRSLERVKEIRLLPGHEFPMDETARKNFCSRWREVFEGNPSRYNTYKDVESGIASPGLENYLPLFFDETSTLFDYIGTNSRFMLIGDVHESLIKFFKEPEERARFLRADNQTAILDLNLLYQTPEEFAKACDKYSRLIVQPPKEPEPAVPVTVSIDRKNSDPLINIRKFCEEASKKKIRTLILAPSQGRLETISQLFREYKFLNHPVKSFDDFLSIPDKVCLGSGALFDGLYLTKQKIAILTESELYSLPTGTLRRRRIRGRERESSVDMIIRDLSELKIGSPVVHLEHGIGRYKGLVTIEGDDGPAEFLHIEYGGGASLYVPVTQLHLISRYAGADPDNAPLHTLGKGDWEKARKKAAKMVHDTAAELLNIYALRQARKGHAFKFSQNDYEAFSEDFPFEETEDQIAAINSVEKDMSSTKPMDRLVCGDVGFGKTEVALRAAFMAVMDHKQVAVLCPTTLLAEQHAQTFRDRFAKWPIKIAELSRFRSQKEVKAALEGIKDGTVDIVVGTHKLLSEDVKFKNLGLVVIDEEHRFGVRQKEKLKALRAEVDVLTLTATPIPRTLSMSLEGIRDFSVIATAPQMRLAIKTFVQRESDSVIREAVIRELKRGGQVYYLHNEVETIQNQLEHLKKLVPEARIGVAHGQMDERELEKVMRDFNAQRTNLLLCTTIIENGIDIPNANTIIMHRADKLGLAQLHQLRGRVGRSHHQAYAYLLTPGEGAITKNAEKRLEAIQEMEDLGSGFFLAMHDLEIRGAGEVLG